MYRILVLCLLPGVLAAADHWTKFIAGPYEVYTDAGTRAGREALVRFEEFRHAVGEVIGEPNLQTPMPVRILLFKNSQGWTAPQPVSEGRSSYNIILDEKDAAHPSPGIYSALTRLFLESNSARMPPEFEHGLIEFFSTYEVKDIHITVGAPPPNPDIDWARIHLFVTDLDYFGKLRVLAFNLRRGAAEDPAYRNAFGKSRAEVEAVVKQRLADHDFRTGTISSLPMAERDFPEREVSDADARLVRADLLTGEKSAADYEALIRDGNRVPEAEEGLGLIALQQNRPAEAKTHFADAVRDNSNSARCYIEYAKLEPDNDKAATALLKAAGINPKLDEPFALLAQRDTDPAKRLNHWKLAAERNPRNADYWKHLADAYIENRDYAGAAKAWTSGEQAATDPATRTRMHEARLAVEEQRLEYEAAEKRREAEEEARHIDQLKGEAREHVHDLEQKYASGKSGDTANAVPWWDDPKTAAKVTGTLKQVDCLAGSQARLTIITGDNKTVKLLVADPSKLSVAGKGELTFHCGVQKPRQVMVGYTPKPNTRLATAGEAVTVEFQ